MGDNAGLILLEKLKDIPFVLITASGGEDVFSKAKQLGARACLLKPVEMEVVLKMVRELI